MDESLFLQTVLHVAKDQKNADFFVITERKVVLQSKPFLFEVESDRFK